MKSIKLLLAISTLVSSCFQGYLTDKPCAARATSGQSIICVCNATYCDEITRDTVPVGRYVAYTSSEGGLRFEKVIGEFETVSDEVNATSAEEQQNGRRGFSLEGGEKPVECCTTTLTLEPSIKHQTIEGFGGAITDSVAINWKNLSLELQSNLINSYFHSSGLEYNMLRVPIGGCDFSTHPYAYNELPENDTNLSNFSLTYEDKQLKIPMIKAIMQTSSVPIHIVATTWSPPVWMKSNHAWHGYSYLLEEYYQTYADYHLKFLQKYAEEGVKVWAITTTNEPINGFIPLIPLNSLGWTPANQGKWIVNNLGPTIRSSSFKDVKILANDDQRYAIPILFDHMVEVHPKALDYLDGVAVHYYGDFLAPLHYLSNIPKKYPGKFVLGTEACEGAFPWESQKVVLGSWTRARHYVDDIIDDLNHDVVGWIDWNICLNERGGPNWVRNFADAAIIVYPQNDEFIKQPMFYAMGHFSKFIPRGSRRIDVVQTKPLLEKAIRNVAFLTPRGTIVVVICNSGSVRTVAIRLEDKQAKLRLDANSVTSVEFVYKP